TRNFENAVVSTRGQAQAGDGLAGKLLRIGICTAVLADLLDRKVGIGFPLARDLESASRRDPLANDRARFAGLARTQILIRNRRDLHMKVYAVKQRTRYAIAIACNLVRRAVTLAGKM